MAPEVQSRLLSEGDTSTPLWWLTRESPGGPSQAWVPFATHLHTSCRAFDQGALATARDAAASCLLIVPSCASVVLAPPPELVSLHLLHLHLHLHRHRHLHLPSHSNCWRMHVQFVAVNGLHSYFLLCVPMFAPSSPPSADPRYTTYRPDRKTTHTANPHTDPLPFAHWPRAQVARVRSAYGMPIILRVVSHRPPSLARTIS